MTQRQTKLKVTQRATNRLKVNSNNPNTHPDHQIAKLAASIKEWGFTVPILADESGVVLAGHGRLEAAKQIGLKKVPVIVAKGWSDEQKRAYLIADNQIARNGRWDMATLESEIEAIVAADKSNETSFAGLIGFEQSEIDKLVAQAVASDTPAPQKQLQLVIGTWSVECTEDEQALLVKALDGYANSRGMKAGFLGWLCREAKGKI